MNDKKPKDWKKPPKDKNASESEYPSREEKKKGKKKK